MLTVLGLGTRVSRPSKAVVVERPCPGSDYLWHWWWFLGCCCLKRDHGRNIVGMKHDGLRARISWLRKSSLLRVREAACAYGDTIFRPQIL